MGLNEQSWKPGERPEGAGRPVGAGNRASQQNREHYKEMKYKDLIEYWGEIVSNEKYSTEVHLQAARDAAPYLYNKLGAKPASPDPVYFQTQIHLPCPEPTTIIQINANIWYLHQLKLTGQLDIASADNAINDQRILGNNIIDHDKLLAANGNPNQEQRIIVEGGLPPIPGTNITMPQLNGHHLELTATKTDPQTHSTEESTSG
jgi:hypothetical protein